MLIEKYLLIVTYEKNDLHYQGLKLLLGNEDKEILLLNNKFEALIALNNYQIFYVLFLQNTSTRSVYIEYLFLYYPLLAR